MNWVNKHKLPAIEIVKYNSQPCLEINNFWHTLHLTFNMAQDQYINKDVLNEITSFVTSSWNSFSKEEFTSIIAKCNILSTPSPDKLAWRHLKYILMIRLCLKNIINIANACIEISYWPSHFKMSTTIIIPKPNKALYDSPKMFRPIVLLNILGKHIEKVIGDRLQFHTISNNFIHQSQLGGLKFKSTSDAGITLTYFICMGWVRNLATSTLVFDISQFFPLLNHQLLTLILGKVGFDPKVVKFFSNYLISRKTQYFWNSFFSLFFNIDVGISQSSVLSHFLALYISSLLHILEICLKNLKIPVFILSFVNDGLIIAQSKSLSLSNSLLFYSYNIVSNFLSKFGLIVEYSKTEVFHFSRLHGSLTSLHLTFLPLVVLFFSPKIPGNI